MSEYSIFQTEFKDGSKFFSRRMGNVRPSSDPAANLRWAEGKDWALPCAYRKHDGVSIVTLIQSGLTERDANALQEELSLSEEKECLRLNIIYK